MAALKDDVKAAITMALACFDTPTQVAAMVKEEFGLDVSRMQVAVYDPTKAAGKGIGSRWKTLFEETRKKFLDDAASIPVAQQSFRLRVLQRSLEKAERQGNTAMVAQLLEQAAKETGGAFTNKSKHEVGGDGGGPLTVVVRRFGDA